LKFNRLAKTLLRWGTNVDLKQVEEAYFNTRVIAPSQYEAAVRLLQIFAGHLAQLGQQVALQNNENEPPTVNKARQWVVAHCEDSVSLAAAAHAVNLSAKYFSDVFRKATGIPFVEYVSRVRVEKAKNLLVNPSFASARLPSRSVFNRSLNSTAPFVVTLARHQGLQACVARGRVPRKPENAQYFRRGA
jgi:AraC-like DNA-binding protein